MNIFSTKILIFNAEVFRYLLVSIVFYIAILLSLFLLIDIFNFEKVLAYVVVYSVSYILEYIITMTFVFSEKQKLIKVLKYMIYIVFFLLISTFTYRILLGIGVHHLLSAILVALMLMPFRYAVNKFWVYN